MKTKEQEIIDVIEKIRPYIQRDGGDVEFLSFREGIVTVRMLGAASLWMLRSRMASKRSCLTK